MSDDFYKGFDQLSTLIEELKDGLDEEQIFQTLEVGAEEFVRILSKLPSPRSKINKVGYTHLIDTFSHKRNKGQVEVGWGKYYGPIVENKYSPHLKPSWNNNKENIYSKMLKRVWKGKI